jgi:predicted transcriptional regulator
VPRKRSPLTVPEILAWADAHHQRTGRWPSQTSGPVVGAPGLTWETINKALLLGRHGLPGGDSLARFLRRERGRQPHHGRAADPARRQEVDRLRRQGLTQAQIARRLGVSQQYVSRLLRVKDAPGPGAGGGSDAATSSSQELHAAIEAHLRQAQAFMAALAPALQTQGELLCPATLTAILRAVKSVTRRLQQLHALLPRPGAS